VEPPVVAAGIGRSGSQMRLVAGGGAASAARPRAASGSGGAREGSKSATRARRTALWELGVAAPGLEVGEGTQLSLPLELPAAPALEPLAPWDAMVADYATTGLTLGAHPLALLRPTLPGTVTTADLERLPHEAKVTIGGLVVARQRPGTAKGIVFLLLEDEFGTINLVVPPDVYERHRLLVRSEPLLLAVGRLEKLAIAGGALNVFVQGLRALSTPGERSADVVPLRERTGEPAVDGVPLPDRLAEREAVPALAAVAVGGAAVPPAGEIPADGAMADFRGVAPAVQSFAAGRRR
jgi:error-prone DNA polymerase